MGIFPIKWRANEQQGGGWAPTSSTLPKGWVAYINTIFTSQILNFNGFLVLQKVFLCRCGPSLPWVVNELSFGEISGCSYVLKWCRIEGMTRYNLISWSEMSRFGTGNEEITCMTGWWFQIFFIFIPTWGNDPVWLIFFRWVETTNQMICLWSFLNPESIILTTFSSRIFAMSVWSSKFPTFKSRIVALVDEGFKNSSKNTV